jgi:hypothetical protein
MYEGRLESIAIGGMYSEEFSILDVQKWHIMSFKLCMEFNDRKRCILSAYAPGHEVKY